MVFKTKNTTGKVLNMKKIDLQQTKYGAVAYTVTDIKTVILFTPDKQEDSWKYDIMRNILALKIIIIIILPSPSM